MDCPVIVTFYCQKPLDSRSEFQAARFIVNYEGTVLMLFCQRKVLAICSIAFSLTATSAFADTASTENLQPEAGAAKVSGKAVSKRTARTARVVKTRTTAAAAYAAAPAMGPRSSRRRAAISALARSSAQNFVVRKFHGLRAAEDRPSAGGNLASSYASYGRRVAGPQVGALAVMTRGKRGGHVGVVSGVTPEGNVIVVSGNHNNVVAESVYPRSRIYAYVMPGA